jgi:acylphosphatase
MADVFQVGNGAPANFSDGTVEVVINGTTKGRKSTTSGETLGAFLNRQAQAYGVRTFTAYADGHKLETSQVNVPASSKQSIEITAKDARGLCKSQLKHIFAAA